jgi:Zn-dependent M28 family amino/carboxypeptidase
MENRMMLLAATSGLLTAAVLARETEGEPQGLVGPDSARLVTTLSVLAHDSMQGRAAGSKGSARARRYLVERLRTAGVQPLQGSFEQTFDLGERGRGVNVVGLVPGSEAGPYVVLSAHYDHEGIRDGVIYNGADDNASGVAVVVEIAELLVWSPPRHPVVIALFDDEEQGLGGARHFVGNPPVPLAEIGLDVNLDMVSRTGGILWAGGSSHTPALRPLLEAVADDAPLELRLGHDSPGAPEGDDWTMQSDHAAFHERGIPFVYFGVEDHPDYHRPSDDFERVDPGDFLASARTIFLALRAIDEALPLPRP